MSIKDDEANRSNWLYIYRLGVAIALGLASWLGCECYNIISKVAERQTNNNLAVLEAQSDIKEKLGMIRLATTKEISGLETKLQVQLADHDKRIARFEEKFGLVEATLNRIERNLTK